MMIIMTGIYAEIQNYLLPYQNPYGTKSTGNASHHWCLYSLEILKCSPKTQVVSSWRVPFDF